MKVDNIITDRDEQYRKNYIANKNWEKLKKRKDKIENKLEKHINEIIDKTPMFE